MYLHNAIKKARDTGAWVKAPNGIYFVVGYLPLNTLTDHLASTPIDNDTLHCIALDRSTGKIQVMMTHPVDIFHDINFNANDMLSPNYSLSLIRKQSKCVNPMYLIDLIESRHTYT